MTTLSKIIADEILSRGWMPLSRFVELALYCPEYGYYESEKDRIGRKGDFFTSVSTGTLFGKILARRFCQWLEQISGTTGCVQVVECGGHDGRLAADILGTLQNHPVYDRIEYWLLENSPRRRAWQEATLEPFSRKVRWTSRWGDLRERIMVRGVIFSNELLDAMPVKQFRWDAPSQSWFERGVGLDAQGFAWTERACQGVHADWDGTPELLKALPDGYILEINDSACSWWSEAARSLEAGWLVTLDYGYEHALEPERRSGTLRAYRNHTVSEAILERVGLQDITAHVDFGRLERIGLEAGLTTESLTTQARFLEKIFVEMLQSDANTSPDPSTIRQFHALTNPGLLGEAFKVLVQKRNAGS